MNPVSNSLLYSSVGAAPQQLQQPVVMVEQQPMQAGLVTVHGFKQLQARLRQSALYQYQQNPYARAARPPPAQNSQNLPSLPVDKSSATRSQRADSVLGDWREQGATSRLGRITEDGTKTKAVYMNVGGTELFNPNRPQQA